MPDNTAKSMTILIGREDRDTNLARQVLRDAGVEYRFAHAGVSEGTLPQLISGLNTFVGLDQISRLAKRVQRNHRNG